MSLRQALRVYLVTDQASLQGRTLTDVVMAAVQGGVTCVQLREKSLSTRDFVALAVAMKTLLAPMNVPLVINDRVDVALACAADGVHLGQSDMPVGRARALLPAQVFLGLSVESMADVTGGIPAGVDYLGVSPLFDTPTKTDTAPVWGLQGLRLLRAATPLPLVAIGGIHLGNAPDVLRAGADGLAVVSAIFSAADPSAAACGFRALFKETNDHDH